MALDLGEVKDEELIRLYVSGDASAFTLLFNRYSSKLYSFLRIRLGRKKGYLADELFQRTWLKVHLARTSIDPGRKFSAWFYAVALNTLRDELGSKAESAIHEELSSELPDSQPSIEEHQIQKEMIVRMHQFLIVLPLNQRTALLLSDEEDLSSQEIAQVMRITDASARQLISRARKAIRLKFLAEETL